MKRYTLACALAAVCLSACAATPEKNETLSPEELYLKGHAAFRKTDYTKAAEYFDDVESQHPYSIWAERAQIMAAYSFYRKNQYDDAILTLDRFIQLHPGNKNTPYAYYLKGLSSYEQMSDANREQAATEAALQTFSELLARFPDSVYAPDAALKIKQAQNHLAGKEMAVGRYYMQRADFIPAMNRFKQVIENYSETNQTPEAFYRLAGCYLSLGMKEQAEQLQRLLAADYPDSLWAKKTLKTLAP